MQKRNRVNDQDTADNYAFTLDESDTLNIKVRELGNKQGNANIRVIRDFDADGVVDNGEVVVKGISSAQGNIDAISGLQGAEDYILQVCQNQGDTRFRVKLDHTAV